MLPVLEIADSRLRSLVMATWQRLPTDVTDRLIGSVVFKELPMWDEKKLEELALAGTRHSPGLWNDGTISLCKADCDRVADEIVIGAIAHELAHANQAALTPKDYVAIERAGNEQPMGWGLAEEIRLFQARICQDRIEFVSEEGHTQMAPHPKSGPYIVGT